MLTEGFPLGQKNFGTVSECRLKSPCRSIISSRPLSLSSSFTKGGRWPYLFSSASRMCSSVASAGSRVPYCSARSATSCWLPKFCDGACIFGTNSCPPLQGRTESTRAPADPPDPASAPEAPFPPLPLLLFPARRRTDTRRRLAIVSASSTCADRAAATCPDRRALHRPFRVGISPGSTVSPPPVLPIRKEGVVPRDEHLPRLLRPAAARGRGRAATRLGVVCVVCLRGHFLPPPRHVHVGHLRILRYRVPGTQYPEHHIYKTTQH